MDLGFKLEYQYQVTAFKVEGKAWHIIMLAMGVYVNPWRSIWVVKLSM